MSSEAVKNYEGAKIVVINIPAKYRMDEFLTNIFYTESFLPKNLKSPQKISLLFSELLKTIVESLSFKLIGQFRYESTASRLINFVAIVNIRVSDRSQNPLGITFFMSIKIIRF